MGFEKMYSPSTKDKPRNENDFYPTPPFAVKALLDAEDLNFWYGKRPVIWEPACGKGYMVEEMRRLGYTVRASDLFYYDALVDYTACHDFLESTPEMFEGVDAVITNPPYGKNMAEKFARHSIEQHRYTAVLCRTMFLESQRRLKFFREHPPARVYQFSGRFSCIESRLKTEPLGGMVAYAWFVWDPGVKGTTQLKWLDSKEEFKKWRESL